MYGYTAVHGSQLLFSTHATQRPFLQIPAPVLPLPDIIPPVSSAPDANTSSIRLEELEKAARVAVSLSDQTNSATSTGGASASPPAAADEKQQHSPSFNQPEEMTPPITAAAPQKTVSPNTFTPEAATATDTPSIQIPAAVTIEKRKFRERAVPSSRIGRAMGFAELGAGLVWGATTDAVTRALGPPSEEPRGVLSEANAQRLANALCRMRGAALKIGQMLSIQDEDMVPPAVAAALEQARFDHLSLPTLLRKILSGHGL